MMMPVNFPTTPKKVPQVGIAFLLSQVGAHAANAFEERLAAMKLKPHHAGLLRMLGSNPGLSQQELSALFGIFPSRLVLLLDQLQALRLIERRDNSSDRRGYQLHLTKAGHHALNGIGSLTRDLETHLCAALTNAERATLVSLLGRIVAQQNITPAVHPAYRKLRKGRNSQPSVRKRRGA